MEPTVARAVAVVTTGFGVALASLLYAFQARPMVPGKIVMATGNTPYHQLAETYRGDLERHGVTLDLKRSTEGFATLKALTDPTSGINAGFVKGGVVGSMQGKLAGLKGKEWRKGELDKIRSVGRLFYEPIWVFTRGDLPIASLRDLKGKRILVGTRQSGMRRIIMQLLRANGLDATSTTLLEQELAPDASQLSGGEADAGILILPADTERIQQLLRVPNIRLMDFSSEAAAYTNRFPAFTKVILNAGAVEFNPLVPSDDITLLTTTVALVVRADMDPALVSLLTSAVLNNPKSGFDTAGDPILFYKAGEFPSGSDPEYELSKDARLVYKSGEIPLLLRTVAPLNKRFGVPFSVTAFEAAHGAKMVLLIPLLAVLLPLMRILPALYVWNVRRRLVYWYRQLKTLERQIETNRGGDMVSWQAEIDRIDNGVRRIRVPLYFSDQLYDLRGHIDLVRQQLAAQLRPARMAAE